SGLATGILVAITNISLEKYYEYGAELRHYCFFMPASFSLFTSINKTESIILVIKNKAIITDYLVIKRKTFIRVFIKPFKNSLKKPLKGDAIPILFMVKMTISRRRLIFELTQSNNGFYSRWLFKDREDRRA
ncbi:MAG: hypothetical protein AAGM27_05400, partial [Cyanobacteria bacterium J06554_3]